MSSINKFVVVAAVSTTMAFAASAQAQTVALATDSAGTTFNTIGAGMATVASAHSDLNIIVRPYAGPAAWVPIVDSGEVALGVMSANSAFQAFSGDNEQGRPFHNLRIVRAGEGSLLLGFVVRDDGPIQTYSDLEGRRISSDFGGHLSIGNSLRASLEIAGLTWDDVTAVPVTGANDGIDALVADRLDASWASLGQPRAREADTQIGIRYLPVPQTEEAEAIYQDVVFPGARLAVAAAGSAPGVDEPTALLSYDAYVVAGADVPDDVIVQLLDGLWEGTEELFDVHPNLAGFTHEASVTSAPVAPYHAAAVEYYIERGMWTDEDQERQDALLAEAGAER